MNANFKCLLMAIRLIILSVMGYPLLSHAQVGCAPLPSGVAAWWPADSNAVDIVNGNNGVLSNGVTFITGEVGKDFEFDGINGAVVIPASASLAVQSFTFETWIFPTDLSTPRPIIEYANPTGICSINFWYNLGQQIAGLPGAVYGLVRDGTNSNNYIDLSSAGGLLPSNQWSHVAFTFDFATTTARLFVNGVVVASNTVNSVILPNTQVGLNLGYRPVNSADLFAGRRHVGGLDEVTVYDRALSDVEIKAIYNAGFVGKCGLTSPPSIYVQPTNQTAVASTAASFNVIAGGAPPLGYQWSFNGTTLASATNSVLLFTSVQSSNAGSYSVEVTNSFGSIQSSNASLAVAPAPVCVTAPANLLSWWPMEGNALDEAGTNPGALEGKTGFGPGRVGLALVSDGNTGSAVSLGNTTNLQVQDFTIEAWIKRADATSSTHFYTGIGFLLSYGPGGYGFGVNNNGTLVLTAVGVSSVISSGSVTDTSFHHVAVTKTAGTVVFYIDGTPYPASSYNPGFTFSTPAAIGAQGNDLTSAFWGTIDEVTVYSRALGSSEIQAIYNADGAGKCSLPIPPYILAQPTNQTAFQGQGVIFSVLAGGGLPLEYQWTLDGTNIPAATSTSLTLENPTPPQGGTYSVLVSNAFGFISSSNALLTIKPSPPCVTPPAGLISWWAFESNAVDQVGGNNGVLAGHAAFGPGEAGFGLALDGNGSAVQVPAASDLRLQNFTIEAWLQRASTSAATHYATGIGFILAYGPPGFGFGLNNSGSLILTKVGVSSVTSSPIINDTLFHHVAVTKSGNIVSFYVDGVPYPASAYDPGFVFSTPVALGAQGNDLTSGFWGTLDEITIYDRALAMSEIQAIYNASASGKCNQPIAPFIIFQPTNQTVTLGGNVALSVTAGGSVPLSYQWSFNGNVIAGATASSLSLTKTSFAQQGNYSVVVTNEAGIALSTNAVLTLVYPPALIQTLGSANVPAGSTVTVPITIAANGNENAVAFSVSFDTTKMVWTGAELGVGAVGGVLIPNLSLVNSGKLGLAVALSSGQTFSPGTQQVAQITFAVAALTNTANTAIAFGDQPTPRQLLDSSLNNLAATYSGATVSITPVTGFEGDVFPRPNGDKQIEVADWLQMGRFVARLDYPANDAEFQRADCAPRATLGDGAITVSDWVQAGRYAFGLDPWTAAGGPTNAMAVAGPGPSNVRLLQEAAVQLSPGQPATASISLAAQGVENALAFSLSFDPSLVTFAGAGLGTGAQGVTVYANTNQAGAGILGFAMALATGSTFPAGTLEVLRVSFVASPSASGLLLPAFSDAPVPRGVSDAAANALPVSFETFIPSNFTPSVAITQSATNVILAWPLWATNFVLQAAAPGLPPSSQWTNVVVTPSINGNQNVLVMPITGDAKFYRLYKP